MISFTPQAPSVCPMYGLSAVIGGSVGNTARMPAASPSSLSWLAVPCALIARISLASQLAAASAARSTSEIDEPSGFAAVTP
ncbi:hypothetical protein D3C83_52270 [compost metagenome]